MDKLFNVMAQFKIVGKTLSDAKKDLKLFQVEYTGSRNKILSQSPDAGSRVAENSTIRLLLTD